MEKTENNLPCINNHNSFAKIIKNLFYDDFVFSDCWYERYQRSPNQRSERINEDTWHAISSRRFKNAVFKRDGTFEKYIRKHMEGNKYVEFSNSDFEELDRAISIYRSIFINTNSNKQRGYIEKECREVFYKRELPNKIGKYKCVHNKRKYLCKDCGGPQICQHKKRKYCCIDCGGSQICQHKKRKYYCRLCKTSGQVSR